MLGSAGVALAQSTLPDTDGQHRTDCREPDYYEQIGVSDERDVLLAGWVFDDPEGDLAPFFAKSICIESNGQAGLQVCGDDPDMRVV